MRNIILVLLFLNMFACTPALNFERAYYEKVTNIKFPDNYKIVATADNGEFVTITILEFNKSDCEKFITDNNFKSWDKNYPPPFEGLYLLDSIYRKLPDTKNYFANYRVKVPGQIGWMYIIDTLTCRLYCEIEYPDMSGN